MGKTATASPFTPTPDTEPVADCPVGITLALATTETVPKALVAAYPVRVTGMGAPQAPSPQVPRPQPVILAIKG